jgi:hypothetical protein
LRVTARNRACTKSGHELPLGWIREIVRGILRCWQNDGREEAFHVHRKELPRRPVARCLVSQAGESERFEREVRAVAAQSHPNICQLHDVAPNYLAMELIDDSLADRWTL